MYLLGLLAMCTSDRGLADAESELPRFGHCLQGCYAAQAAAGWPLLGEPKSVTNGFMITGSAS